MSAKDRKKIIKVCKRKGIPYVGVIISPDKFEMKDCSILCENCQRIKQCNKRKRSPKCCVPQSPDKVRV